MCWSFHYSGCLCGPQWHSSYQWRPNLWKHSAKNTHRSGRNDTNLELLPSQWNIIKHNGVLKWNKQYFEYIHPRPHPKPHGIYSLRTPLPRVCYRGHLPSQYIICLLPPPKVKTNSNNVSHDEKALHLLLPILTSIIPCSTTYWCSLTSAAHWQSPERRHDEWSRLRCNRNELAGSVGSVGV